MALQLIPVVETLSALRIRTGKRLKATVRSPVSVQVVQIDENLFADIALVLGFAW